MNNKYSLKIILLLTPIFSFFLPTWGAPGGHGFCVFDCGKDPKSLQLEASSYISSFVKASQAFFTEYGKLPASAKDIGQYLSVTGCKTNDLRKCHNSASDIFSSDKDYSDKEITRWYSPSGNYEIEMKSDNDQNIFVATPTWKLKKKGLGVSGCFNSKNGKTKILEMDTKGTNVEIANCSD